MSDSTPTIATWRPEVKQPKTVHRKVIALIVLWFTLGITRLVLDLPTSIESGLRLGSVAAIAFIPFTRLREQHDDSVFADPDDTSVSFAEIRIFSGEKQIGIDRGLVFFDQNRICFDGNRTSFAIGGQDVLPADQWPVLQRLHGVIPYDETVPLRPIGNQYVYVEIVAVTRPGVRMEHQRDLYLRRQLRDFVRYPMASQVERQLPPLEPKP